MDKVSEIGQRLKVLLGVHVDQIGLLVWPDESGLGATDVRLHVSWTNINAERKELIIGTSSDGQTPVVESDNWPKDLTFPLDMLEERRIVWSQEKFWSDGRSHAYELFVCQPSTRSEFCKYTGLAISKVFVIAFESDRSLPTGVCIEFSGGHRIWSVPSTNGNQVLTSIEKHDFPESVVEICV